MGWVRPFITESRSVTDMWTRTLGTSTLATSRRKSSLEPLKLSSIAVYINLVMNVRGLSIRQLSDDLRSPLDVNIDDCALPPSRDVTLDVISYA